MTTLLTRLAEKSDLKDHPRAVRVALNIVKHLATLPPMTDDLYIPDTRTTNRIPASLFAVTSSVHCCLGGVLKLKSKLVYNNMKSVDVVEEEVHSDITPKEGPFSLKIRFRLSSQLSAARALSIPFTSDKAFSEAREGFPGRARGQKVQLISRIKDIIKNYDSTFGGFIEFLQNASDSKATSFKFLLDLRKWPTDVLFKETMAPLQSEAIIFWNDAQFTPSDFDNMLSIDDSTKRTKADALGTYGQGFNTAYGFTDVPALLSGDRLVLLDPSNKYLPLANNAEAGVEVSLAKARRFHDQMAPFYLPELFSYPNTDKFVLYSFLHPPLTPDAACSYPHTMFRLALRTEELAKKPSLKNEAFTPDMAHRLQKEVEEQAVSLILFVPHIMEVITYVKQADQSPLKQLCVIRKTPLEKPALTTGHWTQTVRINQTEVKWLLYRFQGSMRYKPDSKPHSKQYTSYATVAIRADQADSSLFVSGQLFNGVPLPIRIGTSVLIDAPFILHSSRTILDKTHVRSNCQYQRPQS